jgi:Domain of unknown function (DUF4190)
VHTPATVGGVTWSYGDGYHGDPDTRIDPWVGNAGRPTLNAMAALAMVFAFLFFPLGIVLGHAAKRQIDRTGEAGGGLATAALVLSYLLLVLTLCLCCGGVYLFAPHNS